MTLKLYGSRGSFPYAHGSNRHYGGNTACLGIQTKGYTLLLDAGSGLYTWAAEQSENAPIQADIFISHLHLDHIIGLSVCAPLWTENPMRIFTRSRDSRTLAEQLFAPFSPPYWPVSLAALCHAPVLAIPEPSFSPREGVTVTSVSAPHPDNATAFRVEAEGKRIVYLLDSELPPEAPVPPELANLCQEADLVVFDACYLPEDYEQKRGWGHSTYEAAQRLHQASGCKRLLLAHISPQYDDKTLDNIAAIMKTMNFPCTIGYDGWEAEL